MTDKKEITAEKFKQCVGYAPINDDLDRCNCNQGGHPGHLVCGWDYERDMPNFMPNSPSNKPPTTDKHTELLRISIELWDALYLLVRPINWPEDGHKELEDRQNKARDVLTKYLEEIDVKARNLINKIDGEK